MKYRKKPIEVEAFCLGLQDAPKWFEDRGLVYHVEALRPYVYINTLEGMMTAYKGDMIIKGIQDEIYPCNKDIFDSTYELVEENEDDT